LISSPDHLENKRWGLSLESSVLFWSDAYIRCRYSNPPPDHWALVSGLPTYVAENGLVRVQTSILLHWRHSSQTIWKLLWFIMLLSCAQWGGIECAPTLKWWIIVILWTVINQQAIPLLSERDCRFPFTLSYRSVISWTLLKTRSLNFKWDHL